VAEGHGTPPVFVQEYFGDGPVKKSIAAGFGELTTTDTESLLKEDRNHQSGGKCQAKVRSP
jgi:hypothetical protein